VRGKGHGQPWEPDPIPNAETQIGQSSLDSCPVYRRQYPDAWRNCLSDPDCYPFRNNESGGKRAERNIWHSSGSARFWLLRIVLYFLRPLVYQTQGRARGEATSKSTL